MTRHHPLVRAYLDGRVLPEELLDPAREGSDPVSCAVADACDALAGRRERRPVLESLRAVPASSWDGETFLLAFHPWIRLCLAEGLAEESRALLHRAEACLSPATPAPLRARVHMALGLTRKGNVPLAEKALREALDFLPGDTPHRALVLADLARLLALTARLDAFEPELERSRILASPRFLPSLLYARFLQGVESGRTAEARTLFDSFAAGPRPAPPQMETVNEWILIADFIDGRPVEDPGHWADVLRHLLAGRPREALDAARRDQAQQTFPLEEFCLGFGGYQFLRAELAAGHEQAAARFLEARARQGNVSFLDGFFAARLHRLGGRWPEAEAAFGEAAAEAERLGAVARLQFELRLACELGRDDVFRLARGPRPARPARRPGAAGDPAASGLSRLLGSSPAAAALRAQVRRFAPVDAPVLITGETGTGKDLVARALHDESPRAAEPYVAVNCAAISDTLLESELFGHERGAFTGASHAHAGFFEQAADGTLFLDEIGDVSPRLQAALLRVLESGEFRRVGGDRPRRARCRILAATNADLPARAARSQFREDLLFRLRRLEIAIPPLRERREDIVPLALHFLAEGRTDGEKPRLLPDLERDLGQRPWPGNVRELRHEMERMRLLGSEALEYGLGTAPAPRPAPAPPPAAGDTAPDFTVARHPLRRRERIARLFREHGHLTRGEVISSVHASPNTVTRDLEALAAEGLIERVEPSGSTRTHYFRLSGSGARD